MGLIPFPWVATLFTVIAIVVFALMPRLDRTARMFFVLALVALGATTALVGIRIGHRLESLIFLQPHVAVLTPPFAYLGFAALTQENGLSRARIGAHLIGAVAAQVGVLLPLDLMPDLSIAAVFLIYVVLLARLWRLGDEAFIQVAPRSQRTVRWVLLAIALLLLFSVITDLSIVVALMLGDQSWIAPLLTGSSGLLIAFFVVLGVLVVLNAQPGETAKQPQVAEASAEDTTLLNALDQLLEDTALHRDTGLTLARLARRLGVPARQLSRAINRGTGENFSRYINGKRVGTAEALLKDTDLSVTEIMLEAGFFSKSTFNTEFRRVTGETPSSYRKQHSPG
ncbi:MAG: AraC family transcriptional regulator [Pseudomonadota bacterium]